MQITRQSKNVPSQHKKRKNPPHHSFPVLIMILQTFLSVALYALPAMANSLVFCDSGPKTSITLADPASITNATLDYLQQWYAKATFFVTPETASQKSCELKRAIAAGHTVGLLVTNLTQVYTLPPCEDSTCNGQPRNIDVEVVRNFLQTQYDAVNRNAGIYASRYVAFQEMQLFEITGQNGAWRPHVYLAGNVTSFKYTHVFVPLGVDAGVRSSAVDTGRALSNFIGATVIFNSNEAESTPDSQSGKNKRFLDERNTETQQFESLTDWETREFLTKGVDYLKTLNFTLVPIQDCKADSVTVNPV
jgi:hypothetical protein